MNSPHLPEYRVLETVFKERAFSRRRFNTRACEKGARVPETYLAKVSLCCWLDASARGFHFFQTAPQPQYRFFFLSFSVPRQTVCSGRFGYDREFPTTRARSRGFEKHALHRHSVRRQSQPVSQRLHENCSNVGVGEGPVDGGSSGAAALGPSGADPAPKHDGFRGKYSAL